MVFLMYALDVFGIITVLRLNTSCNRDVRSWLCFAAHACKHLIFGVDVKLMLVNLVSDT